MVSDLLEDRRDERERTALERCWRCSARDAVGGCGQQPVTPDWKTSAATPAGARSIIDPESCGACHEIPGIADANGQVGPPLTHFARRTVIAGMLPNTPANLVRWIRVSAGRDARQRHAEQRARPSPGA